MLKITMKLEIKPVKKISQSDRKGRELYNFLETDIDNNESGTSRRAEGLA